MSGRVLLAEDYRDTRERMGEALESAGFEVVGAADGSEAYEILLREDIAVVVSDFRMGGLDGLELYEKIRDEGMAVPFVLYSASAPSTVPFQAGRDGIVQFLDYPFDVQTQLVPTIKRALNRRTGVRPRKSAASPVTLIGRSQALSLIREEIRRYAPTTASVLITGETGTGKELVARSLHHSSGRAGSPFIKVNCPALPASLVESELFGHERGAFTGAAKAKKGRFETAQGGTIFLDEIAEIDPQLQAKLLQVLQDGTFERVGSTETMRADARVVAATNRDLRKEVRAGAFREDLYYRLAQTEIHVPSLRERPADIEPLARAFLEEYASEHDRPAPSLADDFVEAIEIQRWHGNIRELRATMQRTVIWWDGESPLDGLCFMQAFAATNASLTSDERLECQQMLQAYARAGGNQEAARRSMNMSRSAWRHRWEKKFRLQVIGRGDR